MKLLLQCKYRRFTDLLETNSCDVLNSTNAKRIPRLWSNLQSRDTHIGTMDPCVGCGKACSITYTGFDLFFMEWGGSIDGYDLHWQRMSH